MAVLPLQLMLLLQKLMTLGVHYLTKAECVSLEAMANHRKP